MVKFKRVKHTDATRQDLKYLQLACLPHDEPIFPERGWWWLGYSFGTPVAFCIMERSKTWSDTVYLSRAGVLRPWRGKGLQKKMLTIREKFARKCGYKWAITDTTENPPSANSLARRGYQMYEPAKPWAYNTTLYWRKKL